MLPTPSSLAELAIFQSRLWPLRASTRRSVPISVFVGLVRVSDICVLLVGGILAVWGTVMAQSEAIQSGHLLCVAMAAFVVTICLSKLQAYSLARLGSPAVQTRLLAMALLAGSATMYGSVVVLEYGIQPAFSCAIALPVIAWLVFTSLLLGAMRIAVLRIMARWRRNGRFGRRIALLGTPDCAEAFMAHLAPGQAGGLQIVGFYDVEASRGRPEPPDLPHLGTIRELIAKGDHDEVDAIVVTLPAEESTKIDGFVGFLRTLTADVYVSPHFTVTPRPFADLGGVPVAVLSRRPLSEWQIGQKRLFDLLGSSVLLIVLLPLLLLLALIVKLDSNGPVLFRQTRIGFGNRPFTCFKLRTMYHHVADALADQQTTRNDTRVTRCGRWLRRLSLDELPQLLNVVRGDMSLVGPRPHAPNTRADGRFFADVVDDYAMRHRVRPGITGWAQVNGWRGETVTVEHIEQRVRHDLYYIQNWSLMLDVRILLMTALYGFCGPQAF